MCFKSMCRDGEEEEAAPKEKPTQPLYNDDYPTLSQSMTALKIGLANGKVLERFKRLPKQNPSLSFKASLLPRNKSKNRHSDVLPYDHTRVVLKDCPSGGDYINASRINMTIVPKVVVNEYIACQGPLRKTREDFWCMVWENFVTLVIMLTPLENYDGVSKCYKYWPSLNHKIRFKGGFRVSCRRDDRYGFFAIREFDLSFDGDDDTSDGGGRKKRKKRRVTQLAHLSWMDHSPPKDTEEFLTFMKQVRKLRAGLTSPTVVHCSSGIGRTGVTILMETLMCLVEANQPVDPLELTRQMRNQRPGMIQTKKQFEFVCKVIVMLYKEGAVKPLTEWNVDDRQPRDNREAMNAMIATALITSWAL